MGASTAGSHFSRGSLDSSAICQWLTHGTIFSSQPGQVIIAWGESRWEEAPINETSAWFYFPDYFLEDKKPWLNFTDSTAISIEELLVMIQELPPVDSTPLHWNPPLKEPFEKGFHELQKLFRETEAEKVVLYTVSKSNDVFTASQRKKTLVSIFTHALKTPLLLYGFWDDSHGILGATPELLFRLDYMATPPMLQTMALAGTQKSDEQAAVMLNDKKLLKEHNIVVEDITERLSALGQVEKGPLQVMTLPYLSHLYTPISVELPPFTPFSFIVKMLHPTPALGGFPKELAWKWLYEYNKIIPRGRYGAPVGYWDPHTNDSRCYVAIRNILWDDNGSVIAAGCGIVAESDLSKEWEEILLKTKSIKGFLHL